MPLKQQNIPYLSGYDNLKLFNESKGNDDIKI